LNGFPALIGCAREDNHPSTIRPGAGRRDFEHLIFDLKDVTGARWYWPA
jgi:hypothetical protein